MISANEAQRTGAILVFHKKTMPTRCYLLRRAASGFGATAISAKLAEQAAAEQRRDTDPLAPKLPHHPARAKPVIFLYMSGGVSHVDTFYPKPKLVAGHGKTLTVDNWQGRLGKFTRYH
jgi:hypothetical protein